MQQENTPASADVCEAEPKSKTWTAPTMQVAVLAEITESNVGGTYTDGSSNFATS